MMGLPPNACRPAGVLSVAAKGVANLDGRKDLRLAPKRRFCLVCVFIWLRGEGGAGGDRGWMLHGSTILLKLSFRFCKIHGRINHTLFV